MDKTITAYRKELEARGLDPEIIRAAISYRIWSGSEAAKQSEALRQLSR